MYERKTDGIEKENKDGRKEPNIKVRKRERMAKLRFKRENRVK